MGSFFGKALPPSSDLPFRLSLPLLRSTLQLCSTPLHSAPTLRDAFNYSESVAAEAERIALPLPPSQVEQSDADGGGTNRLATGEIGDTVAVFQFDSYLSKSLLTKKIS